VKNVTRFVCGALGLLCLESSAGNINVEATDAGLDVVWYDFDGAPTYRFDLPVAARDR
jgi:hypothetical protein